MAIVFPFWDQEEISRICKTIQNTSTITTFSSPLIFSFWIISFSFFNIRIYNLEFSQTSTEILHWCSMFTAVWCKNIWLKMVMEHLHRTDHLVLKLSGDLANGPLYLLSSLKKLNNLKVAITSWTQASLDSINIKAGFKGTKKNAPWSLRFISNLLYQAVLAGCVPEHHHSRAVPRRLFWWYTQKSSVLSNTLEWIILLITCNYFRFSTQILLGILFVSESLSSPGRTWQQTVCQKEALLLQI